MFFFIEYDRRKGQIIELKKFDDSKRDDASDYRTQKEITLNRNGIEHEIVLLEAENEEALRKTHSRYFKTLINIAKSGLAEIQKKSA